MIYIGVDPGEVTGIAFLDLHLQHFSAEVPATEVVPFLKNVCEASTDDISMGCEQYVQKRNQRLTEQPQAQRLTGAVEALGYRTRLIMPSTAKTMCDDQRLKDLGWYEKTPDGHKNDAGRVLFALIAITSPQMIQRLLPLL